MNKPPPPPGPKKSGSSKFRKIFKWIGIPILILVGLVVTTAAILVIWPDLDPPDDAAMLPQFDPVSPENPLAQFDTWLDTHPLDRIDERRSITREEVPWDPALADELLNENQEVLGQFRELLKTDISEWRWREGDAIASITAMSDNFGDYTAIAGLALIESLREAEKGNPDAALDSATGLVRFGAGIRGAQGTLVHLLVGMSVGQVGLRSVKETAASPGISLEQLEELIANLEGLEPRIEDVQFAFKAEYLTFKRMIDDLRAGEFNPEQYSDAEFSGAALLLLQRNQTLKLYLDLTAPANAALEEKNWAKTRKAYDLQKEKIIEIKSSVPWLFIGPNPIGKILVTISLPATLTMTERFLETQANHRLTLTMLALRRHELDRGELPESLESLVPEFLPSIPEDPFTNQPIRWDPGSLILYSTDRDQIDDGGTIDRPKGSGFRDEPGWDLGMKYWWAEIAEEPDAHSGN